VASSVAYLEETRDRSKVDEETTLHETKSFELFQLFSLANDEDQSIEVVETQEIDFEEVVQRLKLGESVFITHKSMQERNPSLKLIEDFREPWYFAHI